VKTIPNLRWWIAGLLFLATVINYVDRQTLSVVAPALTAELNLSNTEYSNILTAFLLPYTIMYIFSGILADKWGTRRSLAVFMAWWSVANAAHSLARGAFSLGAFRFLLGVGESGNFMAAEKAISEWFPPRERAFANGLVNAAAATGAIISPPLITWITLRYGWRAAFVMTGSLGFIWLIGWLAVYYLPGQHPRLSRTELDYITSQMPPPVAKHKIAWASLLRFRQTWGLLLARVFGDPVWWFYLFWLPKYLKDVRHFTLAEIGLVAWMPYLTADLGSLTGGWFSGYLVRRGLPAVQARVRTMIPCVCLMPLGVMVGFLPSSTAALALICLVTFLHMAWKTNLMTMTNDVFPAKIVGSIAGIVGLGAGLGGSLFTPLVGRIVDAFSYTPVFVLMGFLHPTAMLLVYWLVREPAKFQSQKNGVPVGSDSEVSAGKRD